MAKVTRARPASMNSRPRRVTKRVSYVEQDPTIESIGSASVAYNPPRRRSKAQESLLVKLALPAAWNIRKRNSDSSDSTVATPSPKRQATSGVNGVSSSPLSEPAADLPTPESLLNLDESFDPTDDLSDVATRRSPLTASSRAALAETTPWFRAYQSGAYYKDDVVFALYLGGAKLKRPHFDGDVIITRCGGHHGLVDGQMKQVRDVREDDNQVKAFMNNMRQKIPIVLIVGKDNPDCPGELKRAFSVLAWFQVTAIWCEMSGRHKGYRYRFERIRRAGNEDWWTPDDSASQLPASSESRSCAQRTCQSCGKTSKRVFDSSWLCLEPTCLNFFEDAAGQTMTDGSVGDYNADFLSERHAFPDEIGFPFDIVPAQPSLEDGDAVYGGGYDRRMWKGFVCLKCKHISPRRMWHFYRCDLCGAVTEIYQPPITIASIRGAHTIPFAGHATCVNFFRSDLVDYRAFTIGWYVFRRYDLGHGNLVFHVQSNEKINACQGGPDDMLKLLQTDKSIHLERRSLGNKTGKAEGLVNHFSENYGLPYKYIVGQESRPFRDAPPVVLEGLRRCQWVAGAALGRKNFKKFNEILAVGYMDEGSMGYHDDGEDTLSDTVVAQCVGGDAIMKIRIKDQHYKGYRRSTKHATHPSVRVPNGAVLVAERNELRQKYNHTWESGKEKDEYEQKLLELFDVAKGNGAKIPMECKPILELNFRHGDFFIMHGKDIQQIYEHGVSMDAKLRFALTARHVLPEKIDPEFHHYGDFDAKMVSKYNGALDAKPPTRKKFVLPTGSGSNASFI